MVGQHFAQLLHEHPSFKVTLLAASVRSKGLTYAQATDWVISGSMPEPLCNMIVADTSADIFSHGDVDLVFSALPSGIAGPVEEHAAAAGVPVFSNAGAHRMREDVPILIPELNSRHMGLVKEQRYSKGFIVTNSNCSTSGLVFGLKPLMQFGIEEVCVTTLQAVSGAGRTGVAALDILGNVIPHIKNEEAKMESEPQKILGELVDRQISPASFSIRATCTRVPVMNGHLESVSVKLQQDISEDAAITAFSDFSGDISTLKLATAPPHPIIVHMESDRPQPARDLYLPGDPHGMSVHIGRIRKKKDWLHFILLVHNTMRGAAGASVLNAEYGLRAGYLEEVLA